MLGRSRSSQPEKPELEEGRQRVGSNGLAPMRLDGKSSSGFSIGSVRPWTQNAHSETGSDSLPEVPFVLRVQSSDVLN